MKNLYALIMAGGRGTRLWPLSREKGPKQLILLLDKTLLEETVSRLEGLVPEEKIFVQTVPAVAEKIKELLPSFKPQVFAEPSRRDTAPAVALASLRLNLLDPESVVTTLWSDHFIGQPTELRHALQRAAALAAQSPFLVAIGVKPTRPETNFGYIELGEPLASGEPENAFRRVKSFREKPDLTSAKQYLKAGEFVWNAGLFAWQTEVILAAFRAHAPAIYQPLSEIKKLILTRSTWESEEVKEAYERMPQISLDYAILEKSQELVVLPVDLNWHDIGSFDSLYQTLPKDENKNLLLGASSYYLKGSRGNLVSQSNLQKLTVLLGTEDLAVIDTDDVLLVADRKKDSSLLKELLEELREKGLEDKL